MARKGVRVATSLTMLVLPIFLSPALMSPAFGAKSKTAAKSPGKTTLAKAPVVYMSFVMTVKGKGGSTKGETTTTWSVDRTYSGSAKLDKRTTALVPGVPQFKSGMTSDQMRAAVLKAGKDAAQTVMWSSSFVKAGPGSWRNVKVVIKDKRQSVDVNPGGGELGEGSVTTSTTTWECDATLKSLNFGTVSWNTKNNTLTAQLQMTGTDNEQQMVKTVTSKRVPASLHLPDTSKTEKMDAGSVSTPLVSAWLGRWMSGQIKPLVFNPHQDMAQFNSGTITPEKPLFSDEPDSKENVKVVVRFKVSSFL